jgi:hypothetical protein
MRLFSFIGGPVEGQHASFFRRLAEVGGSPPGRRLYPHVDQDGRALHLIDASSESEIEAHLAQFGPIYEHGADRRGRSGSESGRPMKEW